MFDDPATPVPYTLSLHDALPILRSNGTPNVSVSVQQRPPIRLDASTITTLRFAASTRRAARSEEHTSELQSRRDLVCRLLLEKKKLEQTEAHENFLWIDMESSTY